MPKKKINVTIIDSLTPDTGGPNRQLARRGAGQADTKLESDIPLGLHGEELVRYSLQQTAKASVHFAKSTNEGRGYRHGKSSPRKSTLASINSAQSKRASSSSSKGHGQANRKAALSQLPAIKHLDTKRSKGPSIVSNRAGGFLWTDNSDDSLPDEPGFYASSFSGHLKHLPLSVAKRLQLEALHPMFASDTSLTSLLPAPETVRLDDMSAKSMARLEYVFKIAEEEEGPLCFDTFKKVLQAVLGHRVSERELMMMFMKIDSNCDEVISWSEYVSFLLCELQKKDEMQSTKNDNPLPDDISSVVLSRHHNFIIRIKFTPTLLNRGTRNERWDMATGRYISLSQDGTVCFWRQNMECLRVHNLEMNRATSIYFTDIAAMSNVNCIVVSTSQSDLRFYELSGHKRFDRIMTLTHMKHMVLCMDYWFDKQDMNKAKLFWGDAAGNIYILTFWRCLSGALFGNVSEENRLPLKQFVLDIQFGLKNRYTLQKVKRLHLDWVRAIQYIPDLEAIVSTCCETSTAMACTSIQDLKSKHFVVTKGAVCFDYSTRQNILICGGVEQNIRGWNPFINTGPIFRLKGTSAVMHLMVNNERDLCISISRDNNVSVFSLKDQTLVQMIPARSFPKQIGHKTISSAIFNNHSQVLVVGTTDLNLFVPDLEGEDTKRSNTHESSICSVLYNPIYDLVVSSSNGASVCVWDIKTGEKKLMFDRAHVTTIYNKEMVVDITAMSFDHTYRRLITGGRDGSVKIWNFHNGDCLRMVKVAEHSEITGIVSMPYKILVTGLNRRVVTFMDAAGTESMNKVWDKKHQEDILAMCYHHPNILITASYDGDLIVWSTETNQAACRLNCTESTKPMMGIDKPKKVDSQRTLIAKKYDLARKAIYPEVEAEAGKLHFLDLVNAQSLASEYESWLIANQQRASNQDSQAPSSATGWMKKPPAEIRASTDTSSYETIVLQGLKNLSARQSMTSQNSNDNMLRCEECRGFLPGVEENENQQLEAHQMCKCAEHQEVEQPAHLRFNSAPSNPADRTHLQNLLKKLSAISEADNESYKSNHQRHSNLQSARGSTGSRGRSSGGKFRLKYSDDRQLSIKENIWLLRNSSLRDRRREADKLTMSPSSSVINAAIKGPQQMITSNSIECLVSLDRRKVDKKTAVVFAGGLDGWIRAWSIHYRSGLLGQFRGSHRPQDAVTCMTTDSKNLYLFSADSRGYIKVWFIGDYCIKTPYTTTLSAEEYFAFKSDRNKKYQQFASSKFFDQFTRRESRAGIDSINPTPEASDPTRTVKRPVLLCSFRGHLKAITSIMYADNYQLIFTGSEDNNVRVWTINGRFVGQLGTHEWPHLKEDNPDWFEEVTDFQLPQDIRRVASPRTLRVLYGGVSKKWKLVKNGIMMLIGPWFRLGLRVPTKAITKPGQNTRNATPTSTPAESENKLNIKVPFSLTRMELDSEEDLSVPTMTHPVNVETSSILGKAYRKITNHRPPPRNIKFETIEDTVKVWPKVKTTNMEDIKVAADYPVPDVLVARNNRRDKYIQQIIKTKAARRLLHEEYGDKSLIGEPSESDIPANRTLVITNSAVVSKSPLVTTQRKRNPFIPAEKIAKTKMKPSKHHDDTETFTIDKLSLEICEIMGEANEDPTDLDQSSV